MPYILLTRERKVVLILFSALLAQVPLLYTLAVEREALRESIKSVSYGLALPTSIRILSILLLSVVFGLLPYAIVDYLNRRYLESIDKNLAAFFKGLAEAVRAGMPFMKALESVAKVTPGPLGREMGKVVVRVEFGVPLEDALRDLAERLKIPSIRRAVTILITAHESGGRLVEVLDTAAEMQALIRAYEEERRTQVAPYAWIVYMAIGLFLVISFILVFAFLEPLSKLMVKATLLGMPQIDVSVYKAILFITSALQAILGGLIVGKLRSGSVYAGLLHSIILALIVIVFFNAIEVYGPAISRTLFPTPVTPPSPIPAP